MLLLLLVIYLNTNLMLQLVVSSELVDLQLLQLLEAAGIVAASLPSITGQQQQQQLGSTKGGAPAPGAASAGGKQAARSRQQRPSAPAASPDKHAGIKHGKQQQQQQAAAAAASLPASQLADLVLLQCPQHSSPTCLQQLQQMVHACLASTAWGSRHQPLLQNPAAAGSRSGVGVWTAAASSSNLPSCLPPQLQQLVNQLLHFPRTAPSSSGSSSRSGAFSRKLTEGEWLRGAERVYDDVQDSQALLQYYRAAAEARLVGAGGWGASAAGATRQVVGGDGW